MHQPCKKPTCHRKAWPSGNGYCAAHAYTDGGLHHLIDATPLRRHLQQCINHGATIWGISTNVGVTHETVVRILNGETQRIHHNTATKLAKAHPNMSGFAPAWPYGRRIRALRANGVTLAEFRTAGFSHVTIDNLSFDKIPTIRTETANQLDAYWLARKDDTPRKPTARTARWDWPLPHDWWNIDDPSDNPQARRIAETTNATTLINALIDHYGSLANLGRAADRTPGTLSPIQKRGTASPEIMRQLRTLWCNAKLLPIPQIDPIPIPTELRDAMRRAANDAGFRWHAFMPQANSLIPTSSSLADITGLPRNRVDAIISGRGNITPTELDKVCTILGLDMQQLVAA